MRQKPSRRDKDEQGVKNTASLALDGVSLHHRHLFRRRREVNYSSFVTVRVGLNSAGWFRQDAGRKRDPHRSYCPPMATSHLAGPLSKPIDNRPIDNRPQTSRRFCTENTTSTSEGKKAKELFLTQMTPSPFPSVRLSFLVFISFY